MTYRRIGGMIRDLTEPPPLPSEIWRRRVLAALEAQRRAGKRGRSWIVIGALAALLAAAFVIYLRIRPSPVTEPSMVAQIVPSGEQHLGESGSGTAYRNDKLVLRATAAQPAEIRVYDERGVLAGRCGDAPAPGCSHTAAHDHHEYRLELTLQRLGMTRVVLVMGDDIPLPVGDMDHDLEAVRGLRVLTIAPIKVL